MKIRCSVDCTIAESEATWGRKGNAEEGCGVPARVQEFVFKTTFITEMSEIINFHAINFTERPRNLAGMRAKISKFYNSARKIFS